jgi:hypothetical protein
MNVVEREGDGLDVILIGESTSPSKARYRKAGEADNALVCHLRVTPGGELVFADPRWGTNLPTPFPDLLYLELPAGPADQDSGAPRAPRCYRYARMT